MNDTTTLPEPEPDLVRATRRGRVLSAVLIALTIALLLPFLFFVLPFLNSGFRPMPSPNQIMLIKGILISFAAMGVISGAVIIQSGRMILRSGQCPPPDAWVWRDTKVVRGTRAIRMAWVHIVSAVLCCILCIGLAGYILVVLNRITPHFNLPAGVKIIEQRDFSGGK